MLVCNAGQGRQTPFAETTVEDWRDELDLKFMSVLHPLHAALPHLEERERLHRHGQRGTRPAAGAGA